MTADPQAASSIWAIVFLYVWAVIEQLHPGAAAGASFGCFFFLYFPDPTKGPLVERMARKVGLLVFSWGLGYSVAVGIAGSPDWGNYVMATGVCAAALAAAVFGSINLTIRNDGPLPKWLAAILDRLPALRRGNDSE